MDLEQCEYRFEVIDVGSPALGLIPVGRDKLTRLPACAGYQGKFGDFMKELSAQPGAHRASGNNNYGHFQIGKVPTLDMKDFKKNYEIADCPWLTSPPPYHNGMLESTLYSRRLLLIPDSIRKSCNMGVYESKKYQYVITTELLFQEAHFLLFCSSLKIETMYDETQSGDMTDERAWNLSRMGINMSQSAIRAIQEVAKC